MKLYSDHLSGLSGPNEQTDFLVRNRGKLEPGRDRGSLTSDNLSFVETPFSGTVNTRDPGEVVREKDIDQGTWTKGTWRNGPKKPLIFGSSLLYSLTSHPSVHLSVSLHFQEGCCHPSTPPCTSVRLFTSGPWDRASATLGPPTRRPPPSRLLHQDTVDGSG